MKTVLARRDMRLNAAQTIKESADPENKKSFWEKVDKFGPIPDPILYPHVTGNCWVWRGAKCTKYGLVAKWNWRCLAHRFSYAMNIGLLTDDMQVCHHCNNRPCVRPSHLFLGTQKDNTDDMVKKGRDGVFRLFGENAHRARLTEEQAREVLELRKGGMKTYLIARRFGVAWSTIYSIAVGQNWKHLHAAA